MSLVGTWTCEKGHTEITTCVPVKPHSLKEQTDNWPVLYDVPVAIYNSYIICYDITKLHVQRTFIRSDGTLRSPNKLCQLLTKRFNTDNFLTFFTHIFDLSFIYLIFHATMLTSCCFVKGVQFLSCGQEKPKENPSIVVIPLKILIHRRVNVRYCTALFEWNKI